MLGPFSPSDKYAKAKLDHFVLQPDRRNDSSMPAEYDFSHHLSPSVAAGSLSLDIPSPVPPIDPGEYVNGNEEEEEINDEPEV